MNENNMNIQKKAFINALIILFVLLVVTGILTYFIPSGSYQYELVDGIKRIIPDSFSYTNEGNIAFYRIFTAPFEVLASDSSSIIIAIILFLLIIGGSIKVLTKIGVIEHFIFMIIERFKDKKYVLLSVITLAFMSIGAFIGIFEEIIPLVPIMIILSKKLGWDTKIGLGMSVLATGFGFSAAVTNPFTIGIAQELSGVALFSGFGFRFIIFIITYLTLTTFLIYHAKKIDTSTQDSEISFEYVKPNRKSLVFTLFCLTLMITSIILSPFIEFLQDYNLILIAFYFLIAGIGAGLLSSQNNKSILKTYLSGSLEMAPGVLLILLATGVKQVITISGDMDTILYFVTNLVSGQSAFVVLIGAFLLTMFLNFFIGSGSAKAFIIIPILNPILDLNLISRQLGILAFQFGDGFSNVFYPTNAVLLLALGLGGFSYSKWIRWILPLQLFIIVLSILFLYIGLEVGY